MDGMVGAAAPAGAIEAKADDLSLVSISEDASPVVKLVNSNAVRRDEDGRERHPLESRPRGLAIKYRVDGVTSISGRHRHLGAHRQRISRSRVCRARHILARTRVLQRLLAPGERADCTTRRRGT